MACEIGNDVGLKVVAQSLQNTGWKPMLHSVFASPTMARRVSRT